MGICDAGSGYFTNAKRYRWANYGKNHLTSRDGMVNGSQVIAAVGAGHLKFNLAFRIPIR